MCKQSCGPDQSTNAISINAIDHFGLHDFAFEFRIGLAQVERPLGEEDEKDRIPLASSQVVEGVFGQDEA